MTAAQALAVAHLGELPISPRDRAILELARTLLGRDARSDYGEAVRALYEATATIIPAGRVFVLGQQGTAPIVGSLVTAVGLRETPRGIRIVRVLGTRLCDLGSFVR